MKELKRRNAGITLVALIITIIILIILAGITIGQLTGNGIFENAKTAKEKYENSQKLEEEYLNEYEKALNEKGISNVRDEVEKCNHISEDISDFEPIIEFVNGKYIDVKLPEISVKSGNNIVLYYYMLNGEIKKYTTETSYRYDGLNFSTPYDIKVIAVDKYAKIKESKVVRQSTIDKQYLIKDGKCLIDFDEFNLTKAEENSSGYFEVQTEDNTSTAARRGGITKTLDLTGYSKLKVDVEVAEKTANANSAIAVGILPEGENASTSKVDSINEILICAVSETSKEREIYTLDFLNLSNVEFFIYKNASKAYAAFNIYNLWLE